MSYRITDNFHQIIINLKTTLTRKSSLKLNTYVNDEETVHYPVYDAESTDDGVKFTIPYSDYQINDEITKMKVSLSGTNNLYDLADGVTILLDGKYYQEVNGSTFKYNINDTAPHTLQAIYKGNKEIGSAYSPILNVQAEQKVTPSADDPTGAYVLTLKAPAKMTYLSQPNWEYTLTRGTNPVPNKTVEKVVPNATWSDDTNANGKVFVKNVETSVLRNWNAGTYTIGGHIHIYEGTTKLNGIVVKAYQTLTITKATPSLKVTKKPTKKKDTLSLKLTDPLGVAIQNAKMTYTINGKSKTKKTNQYGNIHIAFNNKGTYSYEVKSPSLTNYKSVSVKGKVTIQ